MTLDQVLVRSARQEASTEQGVIAFLRASLASRARAF